MHRLETSTAQTQSNRACDRCRRLKAKCDSIDYACTNCTKADQRCTFHIPPGKRGPRGRPRRSVATAVPEPAPVIIGTPQSITTSNTDGELPTSLTTHSRSPPTSATSQLCPVSISQQPLPTPHRASSVCAWQNLSVTIGIIKAQVAPKTFEDIVRQCTDLFFEYISPYTILVDEAHFRAIVEHAFLSPISEAGPSRSAAALITALCAKVCFFLSSDLFAEGRALGELFLKASRDILKDYSEEDLTNPNAESIAIRYLHSNCLHTSARQKISWHVFGEAVRITLDMRLHDETSYASLTPLEADLRRRAFWQVYVGDKSMSILKSVPSVLHKFSFTKGITVSFPSAENDENLIAFNACIRMWQYSSDILLQLTSIRDRQSTFGVPFGTLNSEDRAIIDRLHICFLTSLDDLPALLQPGVPNNFRDCSSRRAKHAAIQNADIQSTYHSLRLHILQALEEAGYFAPIDLHKGMLVIRKTEVAQEMVRFIQNAPFWSLQVNGEPCMEKIRLVGATLLAVIHDEETSPLAVRAQRDVSVLLNILTQLDSRASIALRGGAV